MHTERRVDKRRERAHASITMEICIDKHTLDPSGLAAVNQTDWMTQHKAGQERGWRFYNSNVNGDYSNGNRVKVLSKTISTHNKFACLANVNVNWSYVSMAFYLRFNQVSENSMALLLQQQMLLIISLMPWTRNGTLINRSIKGI